MNNSIDISSVQQKYFFWGSASPDQFGIYSPVMNRFLLTDQSCDCLEYVIFLLSSKINLVIVPLHLSPNFGRNLIDNSCCENWGVVDWPPGAGQIPAHHFIKQHEYLLQTCGKLVEFSRLDNIDYLKKISLLACHVVRFFKFNRNMMYNRFHDMISMPFQAEESQYYLAKQKERKCFDLIYHCDDYDVAEKTIESILDKELSDLLYFNI